MSRYRRVYEMGVHMDNYDWRVPDGIKEDITLMKEGRCAEFGRDCHAFEGEIDSESDPHVILNSIALLNRNARMLFEKLDHPKLPIIKAPMSEALSYLQAQGDSLNQLVEELKMFEMFQTQLKQTVSESNEINEVAIHVKLK